jgi:hypothetical protein
MALHHVATVGLAVLSLLSLVLFRAIGPPPLRPTLPPRLLPPLSRSANPSTRPNPHRLLLATNTTTTTTTTAPKPPGRRRPWVLWPTTTMAVGALWAIKIGKPEWGEDPHSYDVSRELLAFTPGTQGVGDVLASILTLGLFERHERQRDPGLALGRCGIM